MSKRFCIVENGETVNVIVWDGKAALTLAPGQTLVAENKAPPRRVETDVAAVKSEFDVLNEKLDAVLSKE